jgi:glycosyl hydrolase family 42 (putative beta-galactosidase)
VRSSRPLLSLLAALLVASLVVPRADAQTSPPLYVLPILDGTVNERRVRDVVDRLGAGDGAVKVGFSGVYRYMAEVEPPDDRDEDTSIHFMPKMAGLERIANVARATNTPFLVHLNGGRWAGGGPLVDRLMGDPKVMVWDQDDTPWSYPKDGEYHFSLGAHNDLVRVYKRRNLQLAARWLAAFKNGPDGHLLVGVSTDSEVLINTHAGYDYNPIVLEEFVNWLQSSELYDPAQQGRWAKDGLNLGIKQLNERWGTSYARWRDVKAPRRPSDSQAWKDWSRFRALLVDHNVQEQVDWIREAGLTGVPVFAHQSPALDPGVAFDVLDAAQVDGGGTGITTYGENAGKAELFAKVKAYGAPWGIFEYNPRTDDEEAALAALKTTQQYGVAILCPYHWDNEGGDNEVGYTIRDTAFERALKRFVEGSSTAPPSGDPMALFDLSLLAHRPFLL